jgi:hypothetical protein
MEDCRGARLRALAVARPTEAARLNAEADVTLAARAAGQSQWGSELSPLFLRLVLEHLQWEPAVCGVMRLVCSTWCSILDALLPRLRPWGSAAVMVGKLGWYQSVVEVNLTRCEEEDVSGVLAELQSMPSLRSLSLPAICAKRAVDAEAVCGLTTLTTLYFVSKVSDEEAGEWVLDFSRLKTLTSLHLDLEWCAPVTGKQVLELSSLTALTTLKLALPTSCAEDAEDVEAVYGLTALTALRFHTRDENGWTVYEVGVWKLDLSRLTSLTALDLAHCLAVTDKQVQELSNLTGLTSLDLYHCPNMTAEGLRSVSSLTALTTLDLGGRNLTAEGLRALSSLTELTNLHLTGCSNVSSEVLRVVSSLTALTSLDLEDCRHVTAEGLTTLSSLKALTFLNLVWCWSVTAEVKQALRTAIPNLTIRG